MRVILSRQAKADSDAIWTYVYQESGSLETADRLLESIGKTLKYLRSNPRIGRSRDNDFGSNLRSIPSGTHVIYYRINPREVRVERILHGSRDVRKFLM
jgi:toxin ParE1/3/4